MLVYSFFFMAALAVEVAVLALHFGVEDYEFKVFLLILALVTALGMAMFLVEGILQLLRSRRVGSVNAL
jgi:hypothetical protein